MLCTLYAEQFCTGFLLLVDSNQLKARETPLVITIAMLVAFSTVLTVHILLKDPETAGENHVTVAPVSSVWSRSDRIQLGGLIVCFLAAFAGAPHTGKSLCSVNSMGF